MNQVQRTRRLYGRQVTNAVMSVALLGLLVAPELAFAAPGAGAEGRVAGFFNNVNGLLNIASISIVTISIIFAGYQIAFNHKRIGDVAPVLIGGFLIGAAAQIARMLLDEGPSGTAMLIGEFVIKHA